MKSGLFPAFVGVICLALLTACGSSKSVITGDFTEVEHKFEGAKVEVSYFSRSLEQNVVIGSGPVEDGSFEFSLAFNEEVPRPAFITINDPDRRRSSGRSMIVEKDARYTVKVLDDENMWFRVESDGTYAHIFVRPIEDELKQQELRRELRNLIEQKEEPDIRITLPPNDQDSPVETAREPSVHAVILDWNNMGCADYAGEFKLFWDREPFAANTRAESEEIEEVRRQLDELYERLYTTKTREILEQSSDPIERLLTLEFTYHLEPEERIPILEQLSSELPDYIVEERVRPRLEWMRENRELRQNNEARKLGTFVPSIDLTMKDQSTVPLSSILQDNQVVLLEFWDNYCGQCLSAFQRYRSLYADYEKLGLEVVSISLEGIRSDWITKSEELNLPWIDTFAPDGFDGDISNTFGLQFPRANYVLDTDGCILKRDLTPDELRDFLGARLGSNP
ncbi:MAG: redoxin domain-containing protein [Gammaproteobacteria bacterium]|nr:redoxin domain-containing protein [Gammaproteobacteria bacterium]MYF38017.1 redoxin domain-containing protein [Gammaproteobacteria bacterium]